jgi:hypothetical protein
MDEFTMVIPSYWGRSEGGAGKASVAREAGRDKIVFDHPTLLNEEGTLGRLLASLEPLGAVNGKIVVISVANEPTIAKEVERKVDAIIAPFEGKYDITNMSQSTLEGIKAGLMEKGVSEQGLELVNLDNYAAVRNICSLAGVLYGSPYTIFIDDDEVFADPDFLKKIAENMGREIDGKKIEALAGYYLQPDTYRLDESNVPDWRRPYWNNTKAMNKAFEQIIGSGKRLKPTPFVFGGNMTLSLEVISKVPFDPRITRGEDIDYLLNLRINGITFYLDRELAITHLPPPSSQEAWKKVREDAIRFLYERKKLRDHKQLKLEELQPYPGFFLGDDLEERIVKTCELLKTKYEDQDNAQGVSECKKTIALTKKPLWSQVETRQWLGELTKCWQELTTAAEGMGIE